MINKHVLSLIADLAIIIGLLKTFRIINDCRTHRVIDVHETTSFCFCLAKLIIRVILQLNSSFLWLYVCYVVMCARVRACVRACIGYRCGQAYMHECLEVYTITRVDLSVYM